MNDLKKYMPGFTGAFSYMDQFCGVKLTLLNVFSTLTSLYLLLSYNVTYLFSCYWILFEQ